MATGGAGCAGLFLRPGTARDRADSPDKAEYVRIICGLLHFFAPENMI